MVVSTAATSAVAATSVVGTALLVSKVVIGIVPEEGLRELMGHGVHQCEHS